MAKYIIRVELHNEEPSDYPKLHEEMAKAEFSTKMKGTHGTYNLPRAEYYIKTESKIKEVLALAITTVTKIKKEKEFEILITEANEIREYNLTKDV